MSQLVVTPGRNAARQAKKLKEIRKVKAAIVWHERERKKRQELFQERWDSKQAVLNRIKWENEHVKGVKRQALRQVREDWQLGPLRPNRAIGQGAAKYGVLTEEQVQKPPIPVKTQKNRNEARAKKGLDLEYPLVVDEKKYFHIVPGDRVVVIRGPEKDKIGEVQNVIDQSHDVVVKGINMQYYDSDMFDLSGQDMGPKRKSEVPMPIDHVRLVIPYEIAKVRETLNKQTGQVLVHRERLFRDVVVDKVFMERHTRGVDPFTLTDYGDAEIPKDHQYDPESGLPIFHRYIAGTRQRIKWPWEKDVEKEDNGVRRTGKRAKQSWLKKTLSTLRHPLASMKSLNSKNTDTDAATKAEKQVNNITDKLASIEEELKYEVQQPKSQVVRRSPAYSLTDTTRNIVEGAESMAYTLVVPPFPDTLGEELRGHIREFNTESRKIEDGTATRNIGRPKMVTSRSNASQVAKTQHAATQRMKTPMQVRWETERAKLQQQKDAHAISTEKLMVALGGYIQEQKKLSRGHSLLAKELD